MTDITNDNITTAENVSDKSLPGTINFNDCAQEIEHYMKLIDVFNRKFNDSLEKLEENGKNKKGYRKTKIKIYYDSFVNKMRREYKKDYMLQEKNLEQVGKKIIINNTDNTVYSL